MPTDKNAGLLADLAACVGALDDGMDFPWRASSSWLRSASGSKISEVSGAGDMTLAEAKLVAAAVNFLRQHHAAIADLARANVEGVADGERYRYLRKHHVREWESDMPHDKGAPSLDLDFSAEGHDLDAAIDRARGVRRDDAAREAGRRVAGDGDRG